MGRQRTSSRWKETMVARVSPWWLGFLELSSVHRLSLPDFLSSSNPASLNPVQQWKRNHIVAVEHPAA
jgi:hypothetical protein